MLFKGKRYNQASRINPLTLFYYYIFITGLLLLKHLQVSSILKLQLHGRAIFQWMDYIGTKTLSGLVILCFENDRAELNQE